MRLETHTPPPAPTPPATFSITGLTVADMEALFLVTGSVGGSGKIRTSTNAFYYAAQQALGSDGGTDWYNRAAGRISGTLKAL